MRRSGLSPWLLVAAGAVAYWTVALGLGVPSLARLVGVEGPGRRVSPNDTQCVVTAMVDGKPVEFGDCFSVRFLLDSPELPRPPHVVPYHRNPVVYPVQDHDIGGASFHTQPDPADPIGRTAY